MTIAFYTTESRRMARAELASLAAMRALVALLVLCVALVLAAQYVFSANRAARLMRFRRPAKAGARPAIIEGTPTSHGA